MITINNLLSFLEGMKTAGQGDLLVVIARLDQWIPLSIDMINFESDIHAINKENKIILGDAAGKGIKALTIGFL